MSSGADVAGLGGFSGRESTVSVAWLANEVAARRVRWIIAGSDGGPAADGRRGSTRALDAAAKVCRPIKVSSTTMYDCDGQGAALRGAA